MGRKMKLDFTGVESFQRASEGVHVCKIASADMKQSSGGNDMIVVSFEVTKGDDKGSRVFENYPLVETALWKLKSLLQAIGMKADGKVQLDLDKLIGKALRIEVKHEEYEGKIRARVDSVLKLAAAADEDDEDQDEDDDVDTEEEEEQEEKPAKTKAADKKKKAPMNPPADEDEDDEDWDDEDEDEEEEPAPKKKAKTEKKPAKKAAKKPEPEEDDDDDDDEDWDEE